MMKSLLLTGALLLTLAQSAARGQGRQLPIIDVHLHALPLNWFGPLPLSWAPPDLRTASSPDDPAQRTFAEIRNTTSCAL